MPTPDHRCGLRYTHRIVSALMPGSLKYGIIDKALHTKLMEDAHPEGDGTEEDGAVMRGGNNITDEMLETAKAALKEMTLENSKLR